MIRKGKDVLLLDPTPGNAGKAKNTVRADFGSVI
jgi:hypothetical protein